MRVDEKRCPRCAETIKADAQMCRHCGYEFSPDELATSRSKRKKDQRNGAIGCAVLVTALVIGVATCSGGSESPQLSIRVDPPNGDVGYLAVNVGNVSRAGTLYDHAADALGRIGADSPESKTWVPGPIRIVNVEMFGPAKKAGGTGSYLFATYDVDRLRSAVKKGVTGDDLLGLASDVVTHTPENDDIVGEHCAGRSTSFCQKATD